LTRSRAGPGSRARPHLVVAGSATRDLDPSDARGWRLGGAAVYAALTAARIGLEVSAFLGVDALTQEAAELALLRGAGASVHLQRTWASPVCENIERPDGRRQRLVARGARLHPPPDVESLAPDAWLFAPVGDELGDEWAEVPRQDTLLALGLQGWLRHVAEDGTVTPSKDLPVAFRGRADIASLSVEDIIGDAALEAPRALAKPGGIVLLTMGARGGMASDGGRLIAWPALDPAVATDETGAGDVFLGAYVAGRLMLGPSRPRAVLWLAAAAASCSLEAGGLASVPTAAAVRRRLAEPRPARVPAGRARRSASGLTDAGGP
jgi:sugar/nucleoside kinase (ribokinase family)